ncbi:hypothetical protein ACM66B_005456 [Microbotryomycetes sp. NB124-2]
MVQPLSIVPGDGVGSFRLGSDLFEVVNTLRTGPREYPHVKVAWNDETPTTSDINLYLSRPPLVLTFEPESQRLSRIELSNDSESPSEALAQWIQYKGRYLTDAREGYAGEDEEDVVKAIRRVMGPTYGSDRASSTGGSNEEMLTYPGVAFGVVRQSTNRTQLKRVVVTPLPPPEGVPIDQAWLHPQLFEHTSSSNLVLQSAVIELNEDGRPTSTRLEFRPSAQQAEPPRPILIRLSETSTEDLLCDLGHPNRSFWKEDDRMSIHSEPSSVDPTILPNAYFWSYPQHGLTFMLDPTRHVVIKLILHSNLPGQVQFCKTSRCHWRIVRTLNETTTTTSSSLDNQKGSKEGILECSGQDSFDIVQKVLQGSTSTAKAKTNGTNRRTPSPQVHSTKDRHGHAMVEKPMVLDRTADGLELGVKGRTTEIYGYPGIAFEVTTSRNIETVWLF